jgi:hypothetical protein
MLHFTAGVDVNRLDLRESLETLNTVFSAMTRILEAPKRNVHFRIVVCIDKDSSRMKSLSHAMCSRKTAEIVFDCTFDETLMSAYLVNKPAARPNEVLLHREITSFSSLKVKSNMTGPKISSRATSISSLTLVRTAGSK